MAPDPQNIIRLQKLYQNSPKPMWLKHPRSKFYIYPYVAMFAVGVTVPFYYYGRAVLGIKADK
ncbi:hypothetical protein BABINDRAFT_32263 [Babjeviella inositovora NRRL Y-12698]|uniref:Cytochrome c oxidase subunit 7 n=1 Tax=Babjeviella inositovora NRRL Y-12698 TaxID=984486 RepID=A0A1E3QY09_9ASCO|nr:uncharacterized protein BABINDRAFT_32263 [Babjeviella inositovora NRRL Y-12698]ODQ81982.1 hypothetical protein BABINDRAFT_32263 [Babjeviella inositovora NRRL Y-12698]